MRNWNPWLITVALALPLTANAGGGGGGGGGSGKLLMGAAAVITALATLAGALRSKNNDKSDK